MIVYQTKRKQKKILREKVFATNKANIQQQKIKIKRMKFIQQKTYKTQRQQERQQLKAIV